MDQTEKQPRRGDWERKRGSVLLIIRRRTALGSQEAGAVSTMPGLSVHSLLWESSRMLLDNQKAEQNCELARLAHSGPPRGGFLSQSALPGAADFKGKINVRGFIFSFVSEDS